MCALHGALCCGHRQPRPTFRSSEPGSRRQAGAMSSHQRRVLPAQHSRISVLGFALFKANTARISGRLVQCMHMPIERHDSRSRSENVGTRRPMCLIAH